jgi:hypothetical protein
VVVVVVVVTDQSKDERTICGGREVVDASTHIRGNPQ